MPPVLIIIGIGRRTIPLPVILFWPLLPALFVVAQVVLPFVAIRGTTMGQRVRMPLALAMLVGSLRGLSVNVEAGNGHKVRVRVL